VFGVLLATATVVAWWTSRRLRRARAAADRAASAEPGPNQAAPNQAAPNQAAPNQAAPNQAGPVPAATVARLMALMPYGTVLMVAVLPLAAGLYLVTSALWTALEHVLWRRPTRAGEYRH
jgi:YidC/Oxa1 family membrane protein insertase